MTGENANPPEAGQPEGRYANYFKVGHNAREFVLEFGQFYPEDGLARLHTRIVTGPHYAKSLWETVGESIRRYEEAFGRLAAPDDEAPP